MDSVCERNRQLVDENRGLREKIRFSEDNVQTATIQLRDVNRMKSFLEEEVSSQVEIP